MTALVIHGLTIRGETETNCFHLKVTHKGGGPFSLRLWMLKTVKPSSAELIRKAWCKN